MEMKKGDRLQCALLRGQERTGESIAVEIREVKRHWKTNEVERARVRTLDGANRFLWVQAQYLTQEGNKP